MNGQTNPAFSVVEDAASPRRFHPVVVEILAVGSPIRRLEVGPSQREEPLRSMVSIIESLQHAYLVGLLMP